MDDFYSEMREMADEVIGDLQQGEIVLTRIVAGASDPDKPWVPGAATMTPYTLAATARGVSSKFVDGTNVVASDIQITCAVPPVQPDMDDVLTIDGKAHVIKRILAIPAAGEPVAYTIIVVG